NSPFWEVNPVLCENVKVDGITIDTNLYNNDGVDPESSKNVLIENSSFNTGDDCIAIKSGRNNDGRRVNVPSENIVVRNNKFANGHGGITVGSEISGSVKNVLATDNYFDSEELDYPIRFKTNAERGGVIENIYITNSTVKKSKKAVIHCDFFYEEGEEGDHTPTLRNVYLSNIKTVDGASIDATNTLYLKGFVNSPIENIVLQDVELNGTKGGAELQNVKGLTYKNVTIDGEKLEDKTIDVDNEGNES
ncbi:MAG: glycosyl hydrolase family 28 protein, partial [Clostridium perfringens]|nr:glycosyl hydrolase family 28 protein [Clostridium perfringens]